MIIFIVLFIIAIAIIVLIAKKIRDFIMKALNLNKKGKWQKTLNLRNS